MYNSSFNKEYRVIKNYGEKYELELLSTHETQIVEKEVYQELIHSYGREDKRAERRAKRELSTDYEYEGNSISLLEFIESGMLSPEQISIRKEEYQNLQLAFSRLNKYEQELLKNLIIDKIAIRNYAKRLGVAPSTIGYHKNKALQNLKNNFENIS